MCLLCCAVCWSLSGRLPGGAPVHEQGAAAASGPHGQQGAAGAAAEVLPQQLARPARNADLT